MSRIRIKSDPNPFAPTATKTWKIGTNPPSVQYPYQYYWWFNQHEAYCQDELGRGSDHPLFINKLDNSRWLPLNGYHDTGGGGFISYTNCYPESGNLPVSHLATSIGSVGEAATKALARSNPSRAIVSVPNFLHELKDLPGMLKEIVEFKSGLKKPKGLKPSSKSAANHYLSLQMGWIPLVSDLRKMMELQKHTHRRVDELRRLYSNSGLKRRLNKLDEDHVVQRTERVLDSGNGLSVNVQVDLVTDVTRWATVRWTPSAIPDSNFSIPLEQRARQLVLGIDKVHIGEQQWNAIPWSWMIDWFANVGEYLTAHNNTVPCDHSKVNVMTQTTTYEVWTRHDTFDGIKGGEGVRSLITKERALSDGTLSAHLPFLNWRQLSVLGALAIQRLR